MGNLCPKDGCERKFSTEKGVKMHHYQAHDERIGVRNVPCYFCGDETQEFESELKRNVRCFCDNECFGKWQSVSQEGEDNPNWMGGMIKTHTCERCGRAYSNYKDASETSYCSRVCWSKVMSDKFRGKSAFAWKGGRTKYYGKNWDTERSKCIEQAEYKCEVCGLRREEYKSNVGRDFDVHHIIPIDTFDEPEDANFQDNLVACCRSCHHDELEPKSKELSTNQPNNGV